MKSLLFLGCAGFDMPQEKINCVSGRNGTGNDGTYLMTEPRLMTEQSASSKQERKIR
jgi:hypothetical protein